MSECGSKGCGCSTVVVPNPKPNIVEAALPQVRYRIEWPGLSPEEKAAGCILPCVALPTSAVVMVVPGATQACSVTTEP